MNLRWLVIALLALFIVGSVGANYTAIIYPNLSSYSTRSGINETFPTLNNGVGTNNATNTMFVGARSIAGATPSGYFERAFVSFWYVNLSGITNATSVITNATLHVRQSEVTLNALGDWSFNVFGANTYHTDVGYKADYNIANRGTTPFSDWQQSSSNAWHHFIFNSNGRAAINVTGTNTFMFEDYWSYANTFNGTWAGGNVYSDTSLLSQTTGNVSNRTYLELEFYDAGPDTTPPASLTNLATSPTPFSLNLTFTKPADADYAGSENWINNVQQTNFTAAATYNNYTGLLQGTSYTISTKTFDTRGNVNATFVNITASTTALPGSIPMGTIARNATPMTISSYDGSGQNVHPKPLYVPGGWNGKHYLLVTTPYMTGNSNFETPQMRYSNDFFNWVKIAGQPDPIIPNSTDGFNPDPSIAVKGNTLYLEYSSAFEGAGYFNDMITSTTDGVTWTTPSVMHKDGGANLTAGTPSFWFNDYTNIHIWELVAAPSTTEVKRYTSTDTGIPVNWTLNGTTFNPVMGAGYSVAHIDASFNDGQYQLLITNNLSSQLRYFNSSDFVTWQTSESNPVLTNSTSSDWDFHVYKSTFLELSNVFYIMYGGWKTGPTVWNIGYTSYPAGQTPPVYSDAVAPVASFLKNRVITYKRQQIQVTDNSTLIPTSWKLSWGDGSANATSLPATHSYPLRMGYYQINLEACNAAGCSESGPQTVWVYMNQIQG